MSLVRLYIPIVDATALFIYLFLFMYLLFIFFFLGPHSWHMEVSRLGGKLELQLPAYATATAMQDLSCLCDPYLSSWQHQILNPQSEARDQTHNLVVPSWILFPLRHNGTSMV